jgi:phosphonate transport system substrate-binding protein
MIWSSGGATIRTHRSRWQPWLVALVCLLFATRSMAAENSDELVFGVYPYLSPNQIVEQFTPLNEHLAKALGRPVVLRSAPNFAAFIDRTRAGEYDIIFTAPHMGRLAEKRDGYRPLAQSGNPFVFVALAKKGSTITTLSDMRDRGLAVGAKLSMTYQVLNQALGKNGLELGKNVRFVDTSGFSNIIEAVLRGEADAGAAPTILLNNAPAEQRAQLQEIFRSPPVPSFFLLGHPRNGDVVLKKMNAALLEFSAIPAGKAYFAKSLQGDFRPLDAATMKRLDPFTLVFEKP